MAVTATPIFPQTIKTTPVQIATSDGQSLKTIYTAGANGSKIENLLVSSTDTSPHDLQFIIVSGATNYPLTTISIPANSGNTNALPSISILSSSQIPNLAKDSNGNPYLYIDSSCVLKVSALATVSSGKLITIFPQGGDY